MIINTAQSTMPYIRWLKHVNRRCTLIIINSRKSSHYIHLKQAIAQISFAHIHSTFKEWKFIRFKYQLETLLTSTPYLLTSSLWACHGPFLLSYCLWVHYFFLWAPLGSLDSFEAHLSFYGSLIHHSYHSGLEVFSLNLPTLFCLYC